MINVYSHLEALWALERVNASTILSHEEKEVVRADIMDSLPPSLIVANAKPTLEIVRAKLISIKPDEVLIDSSKPKPRIEATQFPNGNYKSKKEDRKHPT